MNHNMIAMAAFPYAGRSLKAGDPFQAESDKDAFILSGSGKARRAGASPLTKESAAVDDDDITDGAGSDVPGGIMNGGSADKPRRRYRRRDMQADET